ncbi:MAG TPA: protoporphyrinogen oxidase [Caldilinea sp.]|nr:protoporphyrinogen oxidase [Anaerolineales bacterium]HRA66262.1 protoporphyrinogen oxidase [Caldilinea sp.]
MKQTHLHPVAIVGGGIAGLSAAWYLQKAGIDYVLLEQGERWGGKIFTEAVEGGATAPFIVEGGPDSFITQKPWGVALARELGLGDELIGTNEHLKQTYVLNKGKTTPLPDGVLMIVPTKFKPFIFSSLITPWGKLRMGMDLFIPRRKDESDETLSEFVRRRLGNEALDKIAEPLMSGIYNAEADKQSVLATFPRFRELEEKYGSLTKGMLASQRVRKQSAASAPSNGKPISFFVSPKRGTGAIVAALRAQLTGDLRLGVGVAALEPAGDGYLLHLTSGAVLRASQVILATPAFIAGQLLRPLSPDVAALLDGIRYVSTGTISFAFRSDAAPNPLKGYGLVIPMSERRPINAITLNSVKFAGRAPDGHLLLRAFYGGSRSPQSMELDDGALYATVRRELAELLGIEAEPLFHRIYRWARSNPQYDVGHLERIAAIERGLPAGIHVTGSAYRGVGIPDCVKQSKDAAEQITARRAAP